jgi:hypothetical protein
MSTQFYTPNQQAPHQQAPRQQGGGPSWFRMRQGRSSAQIRLMLVSRVPVLGTAQTCSMPLRNALPSER